MKLKDFKKRIKKVTKSSVFKLLLGELVNLKKQIRSRPRIRFVLVLIAILGVAYLASSKVITMLSPKEAEIRIKSQPLLVAVSTEQPENTDLEIGQTVSSKRSPFEFQRPVEGYISQGYNFYHRANDIATSLGTSIHPLGSGVVEFAGRVNDGKGNIVVINHGDGLKSLYAHMGKINVGAGNLVDAKSVIGTVGLTGLTTGAHVHLEIYDNDNLINPSSVLPQ